MPMMSMRPSGRSSATIATTLEVPTSRPTMRFLFSLAMSGSAGHIPVRIGMGALRNAQRKTVRVAQIDVIGPARKLAQRSWIYRDKAREPVGDGVALGLAPEPHDKAVGELEPQRRHNLSERGVPARHFALGAGGAGEQRQGCVAAPGKELTVSVHQPRVLVPAPVRERYVLLEPHLEPIGPEAPHLGSAHPRNALEQLANCLQIHAEKRASHPILEHVYELGTRDVQQFALHADAPQRKRRGFE